MWHDMLKFKYDTSSMDITILFGDNKWRHCHEFWGKIPNMVYSPTIDDSILALTFYWMKQKVPLLNSSHSSCKLLLIKIGRAHF